MTTIVSLLQLARSSLKKRLLEYFFTHSDTSHHLREIAHLIKADPANLSRELKRLEKEGIFLSSKRGNQKLFSLNRNYPLYDELKSITEKTLKPHTAGKPKHNATLYVVAGPNGSGKTTFARKFLPEYVKCKQFVNADLIAGGLAPFSPEAAALHAGRLLVEEIKKLSDKGMDFGFETTLSGKSYAVTLKKLKDEGYQIQLFFLWIPTIDLALSRIKDRVKRGGHDIPEPVVRRRFHKGIQHLFSLYRPLIDSWILFDNSGSDPDLIAYEENRTVHVVAEPLFEKIKKIAGMK
ncbi:MAG: zeta toxin family protein [Candidatus Omnitrophica bacterium]|nr:zeta toxin family protein [Candidatus Omnitrophota bacterium]